MYKKIAFISLLVWCCNVIVHAQRTQGIPSFTKANGPQQALPVVPDRTIYNYSYRSDLSSYIPYSDTLVHRVDNYNPATEIGNQHLNLGNLASAATPVRYQIQNKLGIQYGYNQYDLYNFQLDHVKVFKLNRPLNDLYFSPFEGQQNFLVKALFARRFSDGISLFIDYRRFNQDGLYQSQTTQTTNLSTSIYLEKPKYKGIFTLLVNTNNEINNGGIATDTLYGNIFYRRRSNIPVNLNNADSRKEEYTLSMLNRYSITRSEDFAMDLSYGLDWERGAFRSSDMDVNSAVDSTFYGQFLKDARGLRHALDYSAIVNDVGIDIQSGELLRFKTGLKYTYHSLDYSGLAENLNELILYGDLNSTYKVLGLKAKGELGLGAIAGDFNINGGLSYQSSFLNLHGGLQFYRYTPEQKAQQLYVNQNVLWQNDFAKPLGSQLSASITIPSINLDVRINQIVENNTLFYDSTFTPRQLEDILTITQVEASHKLKLGSLHLDNSILLQELSSDSISLPKLVLNQELYVQFKLFDKRLETQLGAENTFYSSYNSKNYMPLTGSFGNTQEEISNYPLLTGYVNLKIKQFKMFFRFENINTVWETLPYYHVNSYPQYDFNFRMGIRWLLND